jgi:hypothetical protein
MMAVLDDAIASYQKYLLGTGRRARRLFRETELWIASNDMTSPFAFESICHALDLDPDYVRKGLRQWRKRQMAHAELQASQDRSETARFGQGFGIGAFALIAELGAAR